MTASSKSPASYLDVHRAFESACELGTVTLRFETKQAATIWNMRANKYRVLLRKRNEEAGVDHVSPFDHLMIRKPEDAPETRVITHRGFNFQAFGPDGAPLDFDKTSSNVTLADLQRGVTKTEFDDFLAEVENDLKRGGAA